MEPLQTLKELIHVSRVCSRRDHSHFYSDASRLNANLYFFPLPILTTFTDGRPNFPALFFSRERLARAASNSPERDCLGNFLDRRKKAHESSERYSANPGPPG